ncbi:Glycosyltransferase Family 4 [Marininema mesophilum]|uniref:Glycosyltransferase Family 4 n=1 Tax=Marininema mesophilum TaxID=1048340 RepID=A0A1H2ZFL6_9BACL|nr:YheC/YheD family protein [Marininema mesophilum]SDX16283.1 Glycosyltransferase Family 4 [Marininema mesophilum]
MAYEVGVLISRPFFKDCLRGRFLFESFDLYKTHAYRAGIEPVFFRLSDISFQDRTVWGVVGKGESYERRRVPLPGLIHNRVKPMFGDLDRWSRLRDLPGVTLFNEDNRLDKWVVHRMLREDPVVSEHLPETARASVSAMNELFLRHRSLYLKPSNKSLGMGIRRLERRGEKVNVILAERRKQFLLERTSLMNKLDRWTSGGSYLLQQGLRLITYNNKPVDIRVSVQRGADGEWVVSGMVAKVGPAGGVTTNVALGGKAHLLDPILKTLGKDLEKTREEISRVTIRAAEVLAKSNPGLADLGLDVGIDDLGRVWIIEVNGRDFRITFRQAKDWTAWSNTFARPMQYAAFLLGDKQTKGVRVAWLTPGTLSLTGKVSGSVETAVRETATRIGEEMQVYLFGKGMNSIENVQPIEIDDRSGKEYRNKIITHLRHIQPDVIHVENRPKAVADVRRACPQAKILLYAHSENFFQPAGVKDKELEKTLRLCDRILTNSNYLKMKLAQRFPKVESLMEVLPLGVDTKLFPARNTPEALEIRNRARKRMGIKKDEKVLLFLGRLLPQKGLHYLIKSLSTIQEKHPEVRLLIVGGSQYGKNIETPYVRLLHDISHEGLPITWVPFVPHNKVPTFYAVADLLVMPSMGEESFGLVNLEGMASGLPVVSVQTGGIPEVVDDGVTGVLIPGKKPVKEIAEVCNALLDDPERMEELGCRGRERVEKQFTWEQTVERTKELYTQLNIR